MNFKLNNILRDNIKNLDSYSSAREDFKGNAEIYLDANENPYNNDINRYPDPYQKSLKKVISQIKNIDSDNIFIGNGSDEVLDITIRTFCEPSKDNIIICPPTYGMYKVLADINNIETKEVLLNADFSLNKEQILSTANANTKLVILCSPNNPTGNSIPLQEIEYLLNRLNAIILVDEAYIDFSDKESALALIEKHPNLIVSQTLSKAYGMAGIRIGLAFAQQNIIDIFNKVKPPYNISVLSQNKATKYLLQEGLYKEKLNRLANQKRYLISSLSKNKLVKKIYPSDANFILVKFSDADYIYKYLVENGIIVRNRSKQPRCENCLRISVGTERENKILIQKLNSI